MTITLRLNSLTLQTSEGEVRHTFTEDLTILAGPTGVGKTSLLELIKYGFAAGDARLASVATDYISDVALDVTLGNRRLLLARSLDPKKSKRIRVTDLHMMERLPDHFANSESPSLNTLLLHELGLPSDMRAAAQNSSKPGSRVTFADVFKYLYIPQYSMNREIAGSQDRYYEPKRKIVFELLFGLTDSEILSWQSQYNVLSSAVESAKTQLETVRDFLRDSNTDSREQTLSKLFEATNIQEEALATREAIREEIDPVVDRETQALRDLLSEAERSLASARASVATLHRQHDEYVAERRRVEADLKRLARLRDAGARLADIEFTVCPRCLQSLTKRHVEQDRCRVCLQPDPVVGLGEDQYESVQLGQQLEEMDTQISATAAQASQAAEALVSRERLIEGLSASLEQRTAMRITPRLQAFSDASERLAAARADQEALEAVLRQWDRVADIENEVRRLQSEQDRLKSDIDARKSALDDRKKAVLREITAEFKSVVAGFEIAAVEKVGIDENNYLPTVNGKHFAKTLMPGGGSMTATQIAYWSSLLEVALDRGDSHYPALLILDAPRLALNTAHATSEAIYQRLVDQARRHPGGLQLIIADNEVPSHYRGGYAEVDFDYENPTVYAVRHPGKDHVKVIAGNEE